MVHERVPESEGYKVLGSRGFALTIGPIDKIGSLWEMSRFEKPKEEVFAGGDVQISGILFNPRVAYRWFRDSKPVGSETGVSEQFNCNCCSRPIVCTW